MDNKKGIKELAQEVYNDLLSSNVKSTFESEEKKLAYLIMVQRFRNLCVFLDRQQKKYEIEPEEVENLKKNWFLYNDLKEVRYIGTDIYSDAMFVKHKVPFLYRSVGKDMSERVLEDETVSSDEIGKTIFMECLKQIESGGKGKLFSYSKSFGKMLIKYSNIIQNEETTTIEIRKDAWVNAVIGEADRLISVQEFVSDAVKKDSNAEIPLFAVDMSNARENSVQNFKKWIHVFLGEQEYIKRWNDIYDPIGDAEVVSDFTGLNPVMCNEVERYILNDKEFCSLIYMYAKEFSRVNQTEEKFDRFMERTLKTMEENQNLKDYYAFCSAIIEKRYMDNDFRKLEEILNCIDWKNEQFYMSRVKKEKQDGNKIVAQIDIYKSKSAKPESTIWKEIVLEGLKGEFGGVDFSQE